MGSEHRQGSPRCVEVHTSGLGRGTNLVGDCWKARLASASDPCQAARAEAEYREGFSRGEDVDKNENGRRARRHEDDLILFLCLLRIRGHSTRSIPTTEDRARRQLAGLHRSILRLSTYPHHLSIDATPSANTTLYARRHESLRARNHWESLQGERFDTVPEMPQTRYVLPSPGSSIS